MEKMKVIFWTLSITASIIAGYFFKSEMDQINDRLDAKEAWFQVGLKTAAMQREDAFFKRETQLERILAHCKIVGCKLPSELTTMDSVPTFQPIETVLLQTGDK